MRISDWSSDVCSSDLMAMAGVFVSIDVDGSLYVERGFVRPEDEPIEHDDDGVITDGDESDGIDSSDDLEDGPSPAVVSVGLPGTASEREEEDEHDDMLRPLRSEEHTSELQSLMRISYAVFCL